MSQIFDGLQRAEAERTGTDKSAVPGATELLRRAERRVASQWDAAVSLEHPVAKDSAECAATFGPLEVPRVATPSEAQATTAASPKGEHIDLFGQFQFLQASLAPQSRLACLTDSGGPAAEAFRLLGVRLRHLRRDRALKRILITSTIPKEGKSTVAANLACTLALNTQQKVLLLEGDVRRPSLSQLLGIERNPGLSELLQDERSLRKSVYRLEGPELWILPAGSAPSNALELLQSGRLTALMDELTELFDWIIIDSPPALPLADTSVWMRLADGIILITRQGTTERRQLEKGLEALESKKLIGAVLNSSKGPSDRYYSYYGSVAASQRNDVS